MSCRGVGVFSGMENQLPLPVVPPYLNKTEAGRLLGVSQRTVRRWIQAGAVETRWIGDREYVVMASLLRAADQVELFQVGE